MLQFLSCRVPSLSPGNYSSPGVKRKATWGTLGILSGSLARYTFNLAHYLFPVSGMNPVVRAGLGLALALAMLAIAAHAQGVYVTPPHCWWWWRVSGSYIVVYDYGPRPLTIYVLTPSQYPVFSLSRRVYAIGQ